MLNRVTFSTYVNRSAERGVVQTLGRSPVAA
jgi:hypothetical protein